MKLLPLVFLSILFFSCEKEPSREDPVVVAEILESAVTTVGSDSYSYSYGYDATGKLAAVNFSSVKQGVSKTDNISITRNSTSITSYIYKSTGFSPFGFESILYNVGYDGTSKQYTNTVGKYVINNVAYSDSVIFTYSAGNIVTIETLEKENAGVYKKIRKQDYTYYDKGNISNVKNFSYNNTSASYVATSQFVYDYDTKKNPLIIGDEGHVLGLLELISANNQTKGTYTDLSNAQNNYVVAAEYTYNTKDKPVSARVTYPPSTLVLNTVYNYK